MSTLIQDFRHSVRLLRRSPGFSAVAIGVLALGIGVNVGVFSIVNTLVLQPRAGRIDALVSIYNRDRNKASEYHGFSYPAYVDLRDRSGVFDAVLAQGFSTIGIREGDVTRQAFAAIVSANYFETLGVPLAIGRPFTADEERGRTSTAVAIASYGVWRRHNLDPQFLGSRVSINGTEHTVVGIAPNGFGGAMAFVSPQWWLPIGAYDRIVNETFRESTGSIQTRSNFALLVIGALKPGVTRAIADARLDAFAGDLGAEYPGTDRDRTFFTGSVPRITLSTRPRGDGPLVGLSALLLLMVSMVLAIACLNLANLMLARGSARRREIAIRQALGGGRRRIVQQFLVEGLTLSAVGGAVGLVVGWWATVALGVWVTSAMTFGLDVLVAPSPRLIPAAVVFAVLSTMLFAFGPAWSSSRAMVVDDLKTDRGGTRRRGVGPWLVAAQIAVSLALVAAAGLFTRGAINVATVDAGFSLAHQLVVTMDSGLAGYSEARTRSVYASALDRVRGLPGVESASLASMVVFGEIETSARVRLAPTDNPVDAASDIVASRYFATLGVPVLRGREFDAAEEQPASVRGGLPPAIVNVRLARMLFNDADPVGRSLLVQSRADGPPQPFVIVGVVPALRQELFEAAPQPHVYLAFGSRFVTGMTLHVRTAATTPDAVMLGTIRKELQSIDASLPILSAKTFTALRDTSLDVWAVHAAATLFGTFGGLAILLAAVGVYGLKAYDVSRRTREIGIRMALGATRASILRMMLDETARTTAVALVVGLMLAIGVGRLASGFLLQVSPYDPLVLALAAFVLAVATLMACYGPARRATQVAPLDALRTE